MAKKKNTQKKQANKSQTVKKTRQPSGRVRSAATRVKGASKRGQGLKRWHAVRKQTKAYLEDQGIDYDNKSLNANATYLYRVVKGENFKREMDSLDIYISEVFNPQIQNEQLTDYNWYEISDKLNMYPPSTPIFVDNTAVTSDFYEGDVVGFRVEEAYQFAQGVNSALKRAAYAFYLQYEQEIEVSSARGSRKAQTVKVLYLKLVPEGHPLDGVNSDIFRGWLEDEGKDLANHRFIQPKIKPSTPPKIKSDTTTPKKKESPAESTAGTKKSKIDKEIELTKRKESLAEQINKMLDKGLTYDQITKLLGK
jgi:hypothetical protein